MIELAPLASVGEDAVEALLDRAFEPGRRARTAYKVRGDAAWLPALSFAAVETGKLVGSIQCWPIRFTPDRGEPVPMVMIGPVAVDPAGQGAGIGRRLMTRALDAARAERLDNALMLIGDPDYYGRFFGFDATRTGGWRLPGPVDAHRLLARGADVPADTGLLGPAHGPASGITT